MRTLRILLFVSTATAFAAEPQIDPSYRDVANRLIEAALKDDAGLARLQYLCDQIGHRLSGSPSLDRALHWSAEEMKKAGLQNVQLLPVKVPHWVRGKESLSIVGPVTRSIPMLGLGGSVGTGADGVTADVVTASSFDELTALGSEKVRGKIVVYNQPFQGYGQTVMYRVTRSPTRRRCRARAIHRWKKSSDAPKTPAAAITLEDAQMISRLSKGGSDCASDIENGSAYGAAG